MSGFQLVNDADNSQMLADGLDHDTLTRAHLYALIEQLVLAERARMDQEAEDEE